MQVIRAAVKHLIQLITYPANSTQLLQAGDKLFGYLKNKMSKMATLQRWLSANFMVNKGNFAILLHQGILGLTEKIVLAAWRSSGCHPINKEHLDWKYIIKEDKGIHYNLIQVEVLVVIINIRLTDGQF